MLTTRSVEELLRKVIRPGSVAFDVGAYHGDKTAHYLALGARAVLAIEPLPESVDALRHRFRREMAGDADRVGIVPAALGARVGHAALTVPSRRPDLSTLSLDWQLGRFAGEKWDRVVQVDVFTLDTLIERYGAPAFCKIDVEGSEVGVLRGLHLAKPALSFEFAREMVADTKSCLARLYALGYRDFNLAFDVQETFALERWGSRNAVLAAIENSHDPLAWGDVYAVPA